MALSKIGLFTISLITVVLISGCTQTPKSQLTYSKYGFSFEYPKQMMISERGLFENTANDNSGIIVGELKNGGNEIILIGWLKSIVNIKLEPTLEGAFGGMNSSTGVTSLVKGEFVDTTKDGDRMIYQYYNISGENETMYGIYGVWYSDESQKLYQLNVMYSGGDVLLVYQKYVNSFEEK